MADSINALDKGSIVDVGVGVGDKFGVGKELLIGVGLGVAGTGFVEEIGRFGKGVPKPLLPVPGVDNGDVGGVV